MTKPEDLVAVAAAVLESCNVKFALIGGCARNVYAPPRATRDVDLSVALDVRLEVALGEPAQGDGERPGALRGEPAAVVKLVAPPHDARDLFRKQELLAHGAPARAA
jgi:hypothetical protein